MSQKAGIELPKLTLPIFERQSQKGDRWLAALKLDFGAQDIDKEDYPNLWLEAIYSRVSGTAKVWMDHTLQIKTIMANRHTATMVEVEIFESAFRSQFPGNSPASLQSSTFLHTDSPQQQPNETLAAYITRFREIWGLVYGVKTQDDRSNYKGRQSLVHRFVSGLFDESVRFKAIEIRAMEAVELEEAIEKVNSAVQILHYAFLYCPQAMVAWQSYVQATQQILPPQSHPQISAVNYHHSKFYRPSTQVRQTPAIDRQGTFLNRQPSVQPNLRPQPVWKPSLHQPVLNIQVPPYATSNESILLPRIEPTQNLQTPTKSRETPLKLTQEVNRHLVDRAFSSRQTPAEAHQSTQPSANSRDLKNLSQGPFRNLGNYEKYSSHTKKEATTQRETSTTHDFGKKLDSEKAEKISQDITTNYRPPSACDFDDSEINEEHLSPMKTRDRPLDPGAITEIALVKQDSCKLSGNSIGFDHAADVLSNVISSTLERKPSIKLSVHDDLKEIVYGTAGIAQKEGIIVNENYNKNQTEVEVQSTLQDLKTVNSDERNDLFQVPYYRTGQTFGKRFQCSLLSSESEILLGTWRHPDQTKFSKFLLSNWVSHKYVPEWIFHGIKRSKFSKRHNKTLGIHYFQCLYRYFHGPLVYI